MARKPITRANPYTPKRGSFVGQTFHSERQYRNALAKKKGFRSWHEQQRSGASVSSRNFGSLSAAEKQSRQRALDVLSTMRRGQSLTQAAREAHTTPNTVIKWAGSELERGRGGRLVVRRSDRLYRRMLAVTTDGMQEVDVRSSRQASLIAQHMNAVQHYLRTGDTTGLKKFRGKRTAGRALETDPARLEELGRRHQLEFEDIYQS